MAFIETPRFPETVSFWMVGGAGYSTSVATAFSGQEKRNSNWARGKCRFTIDSGELSRVQVASAIAYHRAMKGSANSFRVKHWDDFQCSVAQSGFVAPGQLLPAGAVGLAVVQLAKIYTVSTLTDVRPIRKPVSGTVALFNSGTPLVLGTNYTIDNTTGIVTLLGGLVVSAAITWSGEFDVPVRFDADQMNGGWDSSGLYEWQSLALVEDLAA
jgi:uncharacterized protein (TIGR02217 family)